MTLVGNTVNSCLFYFKSSELVSILPPFPFPVDICHIVIKIMFLTQKCIISYSCLKKTLYTWNLNSLPWLQGPKQSEPASPSTPCPSTTPFSLKPCLISHLCVTHRPFPLLALSAQWGNPSARIALPTDLCMATSFSSLSSQLRKPMAG